MNAALDEELRALDMAGLKRSLRQVHQRRAGTVRLNDERVADFASNDYLGLAADPRVADAARAVLQTEGTGAAAARLISGNHPLHESLEYALARLKGCDRTLLFPSGYMVNVGAIPALADRGDVIYSDALNHASLIDGCRLSHATVRVFPHNDLAALEQMLERERHQYRRALIVVEGVFSMDGDCCPLDQLVPIARRHQAWTYVDDAHGTGRIAQSEGWRREAVRERARHVRTRLREAGFTPTGDDDGHIVPLVVGDPARTMAMVTNLHHRGFLVGGVRPPTVPAGTSRLRLSMSAVHPLELVDALATTLIERLHGS